MEQYDLKEILPHIDPSRLDYTEWVTVGMALKDSGYSVRDFENWSSRDIKRFKNGECQKKWNSFNGSAQPVTGGTIVQLARNQGWQPDAQCGRELDWGDAIGSKDERIVVNTDWLESREVHEPDKWDPVKDLITYLEIIFESSDKIGYVTRSYESEGRYLPDKGCFDRTAGQLIELLQKCKGDIGSVLGDYNPEVGAWIRFNPLDGKGVKNDNVTDFRFALVESDETDIDRQNAIIRELELPVACLVHSGKKSLHAIVRVEAASYEEYRKRVDYLYTICQKNGLRIDSQNRNPSRLSRMPGVMRAGKKQFLVDTNIGKRSWTEWVEWIESVNDDLPEPESIASVWDALPDLAPPLIDGVLRQGHKMLLAGPSKAGKSFALIELCCAIAEGRRWMAWQCAKGRVMYVNLELDRASCLHRFKDVYTALGWAPDNISSIDVWNLRGKSVPMDKLAPKLIRRAAKKNYTAIIIDPIYKVITGDENSADQMAHFCNQFDRVCTDLGSAVIYCHHHSKGGQGQKRSMDRAAGSGVFARDPDALLDYIELETTEALMAQEENKAVAAACCDFLNAAVENWDDHASQDDMCSAVSMLKISEKLLSSASFSVLREKVISARAAAQQRSAWRIEGTLREFPKFAPVNIWFSYPIHYADSVGSLKDVQADGMTVGYAFKKSKKTPADRALEKVKQLDTAYQALSMSGDVTITDIVTYTGLTKNTVRDRIDQSGKYTRDNGVVRPML